MASQVAKRINEYFQNAQGDRPAGQNANGVTYRSMLVQLATNAGNDGRFALNVTNNVNGGDYEVAALASSSDRLTPLNQSINFFANGNANQASLIGPQNQRRLVIIDGSSRSILYNEELPDFGVNFLPESTVAVMRAAVEMAQMPSLESYALWAETNITDAPLRGEQEDVDGDGIVNLLEYAFGLDPNVSDSSQGPRVLIDGETRKLVYQRSQTAAVSPFTYRAGDDLDDLALMSLDEVLNDQGDGTEEVTVTLPASEPKYFVQLVTSSQ